MANFRLFAGSELSLGAVLARRSRSPRKSSRGAEHAAGGKSVQFEKEAQAALGLPPGVHSYALLPIGYPMGRFGPVRRVALSDVVCEDRWGQPYRDLSRRQTGDVLF
jgi:hypothetical protein